MKEPLPCFEGATLRKADSNDVELYFAWLNSPELMRVSGRSKKINYADHCRWFTRSLSSHSVSLYILLDSKDNIIGQVSFTQVYGEWLVGFHVVPDFRSKGWGRYLIASGLKAWRLDHPMATSVHAMVRVGNENSERVLIACNFKITDNSLWRSGNEFRRFDYEIDTIEFF